MSEDTGMSDVHDCGGDAAAYALGALEPSEVTAFEEHLAQCSICRDEVEALRGVVDALPMAAPQYPAPRRLRRRVMAAIQEEQAGQHARSSRRGPGWFAWPSPAGLGGALVAACVVAALVVVLIGSGANSAGRLIRAQVSGINGSAQLRVIDSRGELLVHHLAAPPPGHVYEVWLKTPDHSPVPASVLFSVSHGGNADVGLPRTLRGVDQVMVTSEPDGGSPAPTGRPLILARLS